MERQPIKDEDQPIEFVRKHKFKDTLALFIVFLSFNHFASLCLLVSFVLATRFRYFLANCLITLFLSKKPSPKMNEISDRDDGHNNDDNNHNNNNNSNNNSNNNNSRFNGQKVLHTPILLLSCEILVATILKLYAEECFLNPIENLAFSILASSLINDPSDCLSYATSCSVLYAITLNICKKLGPLSHFTGVWDNYGEFRYFTIPIWRPGRHLKFRGVEESFIINYLNKYVHHLLYYISFHIVVFQFSQSIFNPNYYAYESKNSKKSTRGLSPKSDVPRNVINQKLHSSGVLKPFQFVNSNGGNVSATGVDGNIGANNTSISTNSNNSSTEEPTAYTSGINVHEYSGLNSHGNSTSTNNSGLRKLNSKNVIPRFTNVVSQFKLYEPSVISAAGSNSQTLATNVTMRDADSLRENNFTNQFYEMQVNFSQMGKTRNLKTDLSVTSNLENFIHHLFKRKNQHLIAPLWSMVVTLKTINFEKKHLSANAVTNSNSSSMQNDGESSDDITPTNSDSSLNRDESYQSVFNKLQTRDAMALIAQTAFDDYSQLNLVSSKDNIFDNGTRNYKVCITEISLNSITFHIENLHEGELIVLVNGVIWSEVSCALILDCEGEELVVVGGLVPACSYDIQFINRLNCTEDYLISDLMVRTLCNKEQPEKFENIDFSFPSYYHRKFLSPLLTLKHSVLTTNTNLAESRIKLKKTKKEVSKKLSTLRQDIDHFKAKISQNATNDEKSAAKVDSLKIALQFNEVNLNKLEDELKTFTEQELELEEEYLKQKDLHLRKQMDHDKLKESLETDLKNLNLKQQKLQQEFNQLSSKKDKLSIRHDRLQREVDQNTEEFELFKSQFLAKRETDRIKKKEIRAREINEFEMTIKGLEQDISRLEGENGSMHKLVHGF
ncbi:ZYRO0C12276p [Zygosaccharomyces rouxii]|uniref:ZYRO0C12276p n=1 Tax=Zygosaccharomyces rouxii (strain ATCC 2623 / CBS 732 / NBRC 1130 / NCYC 568 / NRRL Y-229) TaxID=559307 RepID=C5DTY4_ZYGRC|nr:uncharacterized protein ZYRO0C12276g [Zygosaccharomyces rouxii]KAH9201579.1 hypothetical protein LQ764DRAFT_215666 [Zygosaccharomyces rouxii]CAR27245.1 ZYRO0C12276p [Zygosaccharomyces rouxii]